MGTNLVLYDVRNRLPGGSDFVAYGRCLCQRGLCFEGLNECYDCSGSGSSLSCALNISFYACAGYRLLLRPNGRMRLGVVRICCTRAPIQPEMLVGTWVSVVFQHNQ